MTEQTRAALQNAAEAAGLPVRFSDDYSGRGMFGRRTCSMSGSFGDILTAIALAAGELQAIADHSTGEDQDKVFDDFVAEIGGLSRDSLGYDVVVY